ncbi:MAG: MFS transporter [Microbacteriaceae bacterium]
MSGAVPDAVPAAVGFRSERGPVLVAIMVATGLVAIDSTIVATSVQSIVADVGGFASFPWLFSVYLLAQSATVPVYAKLADLVGRRPIILVGIGLFLLGSVLCALAGSMGALIVARLLQGVGAGAVQPMSVTIMGDIYTVAERARAQAYVASVWAASSVIGPTLGGVFSQFVSWRWIFIVNVPLCLIAIVLIVRGLHERVERQRHRIDYAGSALLTAALALLILGVLEGGQAWAWASPWSIGCFAAGSALLLGFAAVERRAAEPVLPLWLFSRRLLLTTSLTTFGVGALLLGLTSYVPAYLETAVGASPLVAGLAVAVLTLGWPLAASVSGRLGYLRHGFRTTCVFGIAVSSVAAVLLAAFAGRPSVALCALCCFVVGLGLGLVATPGLVAAQSSVAWSERGVVTGASMFARSIGSAVGVAIYGAVANAVFAASPGGETDPAAMTRAGQAVFAGVAIAALATLAATLAMPRTGPPDTGPPGAGSAPAGPSG